MIFNAPRLALPPAKQGPYGKAWRMDIAAIRAHYGKQGAEICFWIVEAPWAHPMWHSYMLSAVHLRPCDGFPPAVVNLPGATHEVMLYALDPSRTPRLDRIPRLLNPSNFHGQWIAESDDAAIAKVESCVDMILAGRLSPDTDFRREWIELFSASNMRGPDIPPGLVVAGPEGVVVVGTGKQNADAIIAAVAGPVPPKSAQH